MFKSFSKLITLVAVSVCFCACSSGKDAKSEPVAATSNALSETASAGLYDEALALFYSSKYRECVDLVTNVMNQNGETAEGLTIRGIALVKLGRNYAAYADLLAVTEKSYTADALMNLGNALRMNGLCVRAADAYEQALKLRPGDPKILVNLTSSYLCYGNIEAANESYGQLVGKLPADAVALTVAGTISSMAGNQEQGRIAAKKALEYDANYRPALKLLMSSCSGLGDSECAKEAEKQYKFLSNRYNRPHKPVGEQL